MRSADVARRCLDWFAGPGDDVDPDPGLVSSGPLTALLASDSDRARGEDVAPSSRAAVLRCLRPDDMSLVGRTGRHGTFFQMAAALSTGPAAVTELARAGWTLTTAAVADGGLGLAAHRLHVIVPDEELAALWTDEIGLDPAQVLRRDPAAPVTVETASGATVLAEVVLDAAAEGTPDAALRPDARPLGLWNLHGRGSDAAAIGIGVERVAMASQDVATFSDTDQVRPVLDRLVRLTGTAYDEATTQDISAVRLRVAAEHVRAALMLADSRVARGASGPDDVLRKLVRRSCRAVRLLGLDEPVLGELLPTARDLMAPSYPSVAERFDRILAAILDEEAQFRGAPPAPPSATPPPVAVPAPAEPPARIVTSTAGVVTEPSELALLAELRARCGATDWRAYQELQCPARVVGMLTVDRTLDTAAAGAVVDVVLDRTPFFAACSGQTSDRGSLHADGVRAEVFEARWVLPDLVAHRVRVDEGELLTGMPLTAQVDATARLGACQAHSATHVLQAALRERLGTGAVRLRSGDEPGRIVMEISATLPWSDDIARAVELTANEALRRDDPVSARVMHRDAALLAGALEAHGSTDGASVRVVEIGGDWSREVCDGTHVSHVSQIGVLAVTGSWITPAGHRGIEARCGLEGFRRLTGDRDLVGQLAATAGVTREHLLDRVAQLVAAEPHPEPEPDARPVRPEASRVLVDDATAAAAAATLVAGTSYAETRTLESAQARELAELVRDRLDPDRPGVVVVTGGRGYALRLVVAVNELGVTAGLSAVDLIRSGLRTRGGGTTELAEGPVDSRHRQRAIARIRTKVGVVSGALGS